MPPCNFCGDVHVRTPDGLAYDYQGAGEFVFVGSEDGQVSVQVRLEPWRGSDRVSVNTAVAMSVNGDRVGVYLGRAPALHVNGFPTDVGTDGLVLTGGGRITRAASGSLTEYVVRWPNGFVVSARLRGSYMDVGVAKPAGFPSPLEGLVGNLNGDASDDVRTRGGETLTRPFLFDELYNVFGDSWRISHDESLFDYEVGRSTADFQLLTFPRGAATLADFDASVVAAARQTCQGAGIVDPVLLDDCTLDIAATGDHAFVASAGNSTMPTDPVGVLDVGNGGFDRGPGGWTWANLDALGGWQSSGGNPGGHFVINQAGQVATDPMLCQRIMGLETDRSYKIAGDYASFRPQFGDPAKPDAFAVTVDGQVVLALPRPSPVSTAWTPFTTQTISGTKDPNVCLVAERNGDDSSFRVDNVRLVSADAGLATTESRN